MPLWLTILFAPLAFLECLVVALFVMLAPTPLIPENWASAPTAPPAVDIDPV
uniref:Uncharacterized protein n=1 Tax=Streptomyces sp. NBC_00049 TaxID=2903617 RepID=A0AAU2JGZ5_9ACTN